MTYLMMTLMVGRQSCCETPLLQSCREMLSRKGKKTDREESRKKAETFVRGKVVCYLERIQILLYEVSHVHSVNDSTEAEARVDSRTGAWCETLR